MTGQRTWITGARGFLGRHVARALADAGNTPAGLGHGSPALSDTLVPVDPWINGDISISNLDALARAADLPERIFHLAGGSAVGPSLLAPLEDFERTVTATASLMEWIRTRAPTCRVVLVSSAAVYGSGTRAPTDEALRPLSPYGIHKLMAEDCVRGNAQCFGLNCSVVRFFSLYGNGLNKQIFFDLCNRLRSAPSMLELGGTGLEERDWLHVADAVRMLLAASSHCDPSCPTFDGGTGQPTKVSEAVSLLCHAWNLRPDVRFSGAVRAGDPQRLVASVDRMRGIAQPPFLSLAEGLRRYVEWYRSESRLG